MVLDAFDKQLVLPHLVRCLSSTWIQLIQDLRDFLSTWSQQHSHWCVSVNLVILWRRKASTVNKVFRSWGRECFLTYIWWLARKSHATLKITYELLAAFSRFFSPWARIHFAAYDCFIWMSVSDGIRLIGSEGNFHDLSSTDTNWRSVFRNRVLMRRNVSASYELIY